MTAVSGAASRAGRWHHSPRGTWLRSFAVAGVLCVIAGGLLAAATAYASTEKTAWATAYLVLVGGVAQIGLGVGVAWLAPTASRRLAWESWACWNIGNAGVLAGQLAGILVITDIGAVWLVAALILVLLALRGEAATAPRATAGDHRRVLYAFRGLMLVLAVTLPIGVVLAHLGA